MILDNLFTLTEGISAQELADVLAHRLEMRYPETFQRYDIERIADAVMQRAEFHAGAEELGTSDISIMLREILRELEQGQVSDSDVTEAQPGQPRTPYDVGGADAWYHRGSHPEQFDSEADQAEYLRGYRDEGVTGRHQGKQYDEGVAEGKANYNFDIEDLKRLEKIKDLATMKAQALELISKPSVRPMRPEKVQWFKNALAGMNSPLRVIKLMYDLLLSGEGHAVVGTRSSMNPNSYRQRFGEQGVAEESSTPGDININENFSKRYVPGSIIKTPGGGEREISHFTPKTPEQRKKDFENWGKKNDNKDSKNKGVAEGFIDDMPADSMVGTMNKIRDDAKSRRHLHLQKLLKRSKNPKTIAQIKALLSKEFPQGVAEGDVIRTKFATRQAQKNKDQYQHQPDVEIPVYDRERNRAVKPEHAQGGEEKFDHFVAEPSPRSSGSSMIIGVTRDFREVIVSNWLAPVEVTQKFADAMNRGGFSDVPIRRVPIRGYNDEPVSEAQPTRRTMPWSVWNAKSGQEQRLLKSQYPNLVITDRPKPKAERKPRQEKINYQEVAQKIGEIVGNTFPDGDPLDWLIPYMRRRWGLENNISQHLDRAARKYLHARDYYDYLSTMWDQVADDENLGDRVTRANNPWRAQEDVAEGQYDYDIEGNQQKGGGYDKDGKPGSKAAMRKAAQYFDPRSSQELKKAANQKKQGVAEGEQRWVLYLNGKPAAHYGSEREARDQGEMVQSRRPGTKFEVKPMERGMIEGLRDPADNPCWKGYHPVGTKQKNGRTVPNCVPNK